MIDASTDAVVRTIKVGARPRGIEAHDGRIYVALSDSNRKARSDKDAIVALLGERTFDVYLNADAMWANVPAKVWEYTLGGYQVIKKWLSYREHERRDALAATVHHPDVQDAGHPPLPPQEPERPARLN